MRRLNVRFFLWLSIGLIVGQRGAIGAADNALPVVTKITGSVAIQSYGKATQDVAQTRILHFGDTVVTGLDARATVSLADVGKVTLGPGTVAKTYTSGPKLSLTLVTGSLCVESDVPSVSIGIGAMTLVPSTRSTIFNLARNANNAEIAVYSGNLVASVNGGRPTALKAGTAADSIDEETPQPADMAKVQHSFAALHCPDDSVIAQAMPPADAPAGSGHGGGGFLGTLLALGAIAAAVGHGGGGASSATNQAQPPLGVSPTPRPSLSPTPTPSASSTPTPTPTPTLTPTPTPTPSGSLTLSPTSLSFSGAGSDLQNFTAHDRATHTFLATSSDPTVATVAETDTHGHTATFSVTPVGNGATNIVVADGAGGSGAVSVTVGGGRLFLQTRGSTPRGNAPPNNAGPAASFVAPSEMNLIVGLTRFAVVREELYTGMLRAQSSNPAVATVEPSIARGPSYAFAIVGRSPGIVLVTVIDDHGNARVVRVSVAANAAQRIFSRP